jgi:hypothetical protein
MQTEPWGGRRWASSLADMFTATRNDPVEPNCVLQQYRESGPESHKRKPQNSKSVRANAVSVM